MSILLTGAGIIIRTPNTADIIVIKADNMAKTADAG